MRQRALLSVNRRDLMLVLDELRRMYAGRSKEAQYAFPGELLLRPYPVLRVGGEEVAGLPIREERIRYLEIVPHRKKILAVDASVKVLFDLGASKVVVSKVAAGIWRGLSRIYALDPLKRVKLAWSKEEVGEWLLRVEIETVLKLVRRLGTGDYCLLDRSLSVPPPSKRTTREVMDRLDRAVSARGGILVGISKSSKLRVSTGESLVGYLSRLAERRLRGVPWIYYPVFKEGSLPPCFLGEISVAKLGGDSETAFRIDISKRALAAKSVDEILGEVAFTQDSATPGYPYPLKAVHLESRISEYELEIDRALFLDLLREEGLYEYFAPDVDSTSFKERCLWK